MEAAYNLSTLYSPQFKAVTGKKRKIDLADVLYAQLPAFRAAQSREKAETLEIKAIEDAQKRFDEEMKLKEEQLEESAKQAKTATGINLASLGLQTGYVTKELGLWGGKGAAAPSLAEVGAVDAEALAWAPATEADAAIRGITPTAAPAGEAAAAGMSPLAKAGAVAGIEIGGRMLTQPLAYELSEDLPGGKAEWGTGELVLRRAAMGAIIGGGLPGAVVGGVVGLIEGIFTGGSGCIIITAATYPDSWEVDVARRYRDRYLDAVKLRGYYLIAALIAPLMHRYPTFRRFIKMFLVNPLIEYGVWRLRNNQPLKVLYYPSLRARAVTKCFLGVCKFVGSWKRQYVRANG